MRWMYGSATVALVLLAGAFGVREQAAPVRAAETVRTLDLRLERPGEPAVELHFLRDLVPLPHDRSCHSKASNRAGCTGRSPTRFAH